MHDYRSCNPFGAWLATRDISRTPVALKLVSMPHVAMTKLQIGSIVGAMFGGFCITFALISRHSVRHDPAAALAPLIDFAPAAAPPFTRGPLAPEHPQPLQPKFTPQSAPPPAAAAAENTGDVPEQPLPVAFHIWNRRGQNRIEGDVTNTSAAPMTLTLVDENPSTNQTSSFDLQLAPGEKKTFSSEDGIELHSRDRLILRCAPYLERSMPIP
jgi:hypothetical protein